MIKIMTNFIIYWSILNFWKPLSDWIRHKLGLPINEVSTYSTYNCKHLRYIRKYVFMTHFLRKATWNYSCQKNFKNESDRYNVNISNRKLNENFVETSKKMY